MTSLRFEPWIFYWHGRCSDHNNTELVKCDPGNIATELFISEAGDYNITGTHHQVKIITLLAFDKRFTRDLPLFFTSSACKTKLLLHNIENICFRLQLSDRTPDLI